MTSATLPAPARIALRVHWTDRLAHVALAAVALLLLVFLAAPLAAILLKSVQDSNEQWVGLRNFIEYARTPALLQSLWNSLWVSALVTLITVPAAFGFAYALTRSRMRFKRVLRGITLIPLLAPSLLSAISLIYWFGNQGVLKSWLDFFGIEQIYGAPGIVMAEIFALFPHALMILVTALTAADARLYEAADAMGTSAARKFWTITLPGAKYGLISAALVTFTLVITDFGIPKVIGGNFNVLATDVFKLVIGQQDFQKGAVVALLLLAPAVLTFSVDHLVQRKQTAMLSARAVPYRPKRAPWFDATMQLYCGVIALLMLAMLGMAIFASFAKFWPYDLSFSWNHYRTGLVEGEVGHRLRQQPADGHGHSRVRHRAGLRRRLPAGKDPGRRAAARQRAHAVDAADGGARAGAGPGLHLLLQRAGQPAERPVPDADAADAVHHRALLHHRPPDGRDRAEVAGRRIRIGVGVAEGAVLQDLLARHAADLHAGAGGHRALLLRQRDDHHLGGGVPVLARDQGGLDRHPEPGRSRRHRRGGGDGAADRRGLHRGHAAVHGPVVAGRAPHPTMESPKEPSWTATASCSPPAR